MLITKSAMRPPTITMAKGRWASDPTARDNAAGANPQPGSAGRVGTLS
jgi:hypothetical protein